MAFTGDTDGKWRSFPNVPNLLQYASTGMFYGRVKVGGKIIRRSLRTDTFTTAKLRLLDFLKEEQMIKPQIGDPVTFEQARKIYESSTESDHALSENAKLARRFSLKALTKSWPDLDAKRIDEIAKADCWEWAWPTPLLEPSIMSEPKLFYGQQFQSSPCFIVRKPSANS